MTNTMVADGALRPGEHKGDAFMRRLLRIPDRKTATVRDAQRLFSVSIVISGIRCLLSYIVLPFLGPAIGAAAGVEPYFGIPISVIAIVFDVRGMRRFWAADHRYRWEMTYLYLGVITLVTALLVIDAVRLAR